MPRLDEPGALRRVRAHPVLRVAVRLLRLRDLDRPGAPGRRRTSTRACATSSAAARPGDERVLRRGHAVAPRASQLVRILDAIPRAPTPRSRSSATPTRSTSTKLRCVRAAGVNRVSFGVQSMRAHVLVALGRTHDPDNVARAVGRPRDAGIDRVNLDLIYGTPGECDRRLGGHARRRPRARARARERVRADGRARHAAGQGGAGGGARRARRRRPGHEVRARRRPARRRRPRRGTRSRTGRAPARSAATTSSTGRAGDYAGDRVRRPRAHGRPGRRWWNVRTPERYIDARRAPDRLPRPVTRPSTPARGREARCSRCAPRTGSSSRAPAPILSQCTRASTISRPSACCDRCADRVVLTRRGRLLGNEVAARLLGALEQPTVAAGTR